MKQNTLIQFLQSSKFTNMFSEKVQCCRPKSQATVTQPCTPFALGSTDKILGTRLTVNMRGQIIHQTCIISLLEHCTGIKCCRFYSYSCKFRLAAYTSALQACYCLIIVWAAGLYTLGKFGQLLKMIQVGMQT